MFFSVIIDSQTEGAGLKIAVVILCYDRPRSLERCLSSLCSISKPESVARVDLFISVDFKSLEVQNDILNISKEFVWRYGNKEIVAHPERLGLRKHVLLSGDLSLGYDGLVMLEDDIFVSPFFLEYVSSSLKYYGSDNRISGISLYTPLLNEFAEMPFQPVSGAYDVFLVQTAQSWGQCWNSRMWSGFKAWYEDNQQLILDYDLPQSVYAWPETSWKKFYNKYMVVSDTYFLYPCVSYSTNCCDAGTHNSISSNRYQVPLQIESKDFRFSEFGSLVKYDAFFELISFHDGFRVYFDIYSLQRKYIGPCYILSFDNLDLECVGEYSGSFRPLELSFLLDVKGEGLRLYYCPNIYLKKKPDGRFRGSHLLERTIYFHWKYSLLHGLRGMAGFVLNKFRGFLGI